MYCITWLDYLKPFATEPIENLIYLAWESQTVSRCRHLLTETFPLVAFPLTAPSYLSDLSVISSCLLDFYGSGTRPFQAKGHFVNFVSVRGPPPKLVQLVRCG